MGFPVKVAIFETGEVFSSSKELAHELDIPVSTLKHYIYKDKVWNGLHFYSLGKDSNHCSSCGACLSDNNYNGYIKRWKYSWCWGCEKLRRKEYNKETKANRRKRVIKKAYGINEIEYNRLLKKQNEVCAICGRKETMINSKYGIPKLCIDHNHKNGKIRGLLCSRCNTAIGKFMVDEYDSDLLKKAVNYIEENNG